MRFFFVLIIFVLAVAACTALAKLVYRNSIETEFSSLATSALREADIQNVDVDFDHHVPVFSGQVDEPGDKARILEVVKKAVPVAMMPDLSEVDLPVRPTLPPLLRITVGEGDAEVIVEGSLALAEEESRSHLGARLQALQRVDSVDNRIELDPKRLLFVRAAEMAALAGEVIKHSGAAEVRLEEGRLLLVGTVPNEGIKAGILELASKIEADSIVDEISVAPPESFFLPSVMTLTRNRFGITVTGFLDSAESLDSIRETLAEHCRGVRITDRLALEREREPGDWQAHLDGLLPEILTTLNGELTVEFAVHQIRISGEASDGEGRETVLSGLRALSSEKNRFEILHDIKIQSEGPEGPPVQLMATWEGGLLTLIGNVPDVSFVEKLEASVKDTDKNVLIKNSLEETPGSPNSNWTAALEELFEEVVGRTENAILRVDEATFRIEGMAKELPDLRILKNVIVNCAPPGVTVENQLVHADQPFPMPELDGDARERVIAGLVGLPVYFDTGSEILNADAGEVVDSIITLLKEGGAKTDLIVTGFADNFGNPESNRELSLRRADAVVTRLLDAGVEESRIEKKSVVENVSNVPRSQRWKSRRVEVTLPGPAPETEEAGENQ